jgi:hypothetical protein
MERQSRVEYTCIDGVFYLAFETNYRLGLQWGGFNGVKGVAFFYTDRDWI